MCATNGFEITQGLNLAALAIHVASFAILELMLSYLGNITLGCLAVTLTVISLISHNLMTNFCIKVHSAAVLQPSM